MGKIFNKFVSRITLVLLKLAGKGYGASSIKQEVKIVLRFADKLNISEIVALDIGANVGIWSSTMLTSRPHSIITAFEPSSVAFAKLKANLSKVEFSGRVSLEPIALGNKQGRVNLYSEEPGSGLGSLTQRRLQHFDINFTEVESVNIQTLDNWLEQNSKKLPNIIKLDVEGHELDVLRSGKKTLDNVKIIQFEFGGCNIDTKTFWQDFWYFFTDLGFKLYRITPVGSVKINQYREDDEIFLTTNLVAVRN